MSHHSVGKLFDLAPDGLGFIERKASPHVVAFHLRRLGFRSFEEAGLQEGMLVHFHVNDQHQIDRVTPRETVRPKRPPALPVNGKG